LKTQLRVLTLLELVAALGAHKPRVLDPRLHPAPHAILSMWLQSIAPRQLADRRAEAAVIATRADYEARKASSVQRRCA
jgi:hypothetical protein